MEDYTAVLKYQKQYMKLATKRARSAYDMKHSSSMRLEMQQALYAFLGLIVALAVIVGIIGLFILFS